MKTSDLLKWVKKTYGSEPEYPWAKYPEDAILRHTDNRKWYAVIMVVKRETLGLPGSEDVSDENVTVINVKVDPAMLGSLLKQDGILPGYHMNKNHWISILLDGTVEEKRIHSLLDMSFSLTAPKRKV